MFLLLLGWKGWVGLLLRRDKEGGRAGVLTSVADAVTGVAKALTGRKLQEPTSTLVSSTMPAGGQEHAAAEIMLD